MPHLFVFLHGGIEFLGKVIGYIRHPRLLLIGSAHAALILIGFLVVFLLGVFAVPWRPLKRRRK